MMHVIDVFKIAKENKIEDEMKIFNITLKSFSGESQIDYNKKTKKRFTILSIFLFLKLYKKNIHRLEFISKFKIEFFQEGKFDYLEFDPLEKRMIKHCLLIGKLLIQKKMFGKITTAQFIAIRDYLYYGSEIAKKKIPKKILKIIIKTIPKSYMAYWIKSFFYLRYEYEHKRQKFYKKIK